MTVKYRPIISIERNQEHFDNRILNCYEVYLLIIEVGLPSLYLFCIDRLGIGLKLKMFVNKQCCVYIDWNEVTYR